MVLYKKMVPISFNRRTTRWDKIFANNTMVVSNLLCYESKLLPVLLLWINKYKLCYKVLRWKSTDTLQFKPTYTKALKISCIEPHKYVTAECNPFNPRGHLVLVTSFIFSYHFDDPYYLWQKESCPFRLRTIFRPLLQKTAGTSSTTSSGSHPTTHFWLVFHNQIEMKFSAHWPVQIWVAWEQTRRLLDKRGS